jgi:hypothetical protein
MVFNTTFKHISAISWWSVLLVGVPEENHRPATRHWQTLSHNVASSTPHHSLIALVVMGTDRAVVHKPNYHTITSTTTPLKKVLRNMCAMNNNHFQLSSQKKLMKLIFKLFIQASHCLMIPLTNLISRFFFIFIFCRKVLVFNLIVIVNYIL